MKIIAPKRGVRIPEFGHSAEAHNFAELRREAARTPVKFFDWLREAARRKDKIFEIECPGREVVALIGKTYPLREVGRAKSTKALALQLISVVETLTKDRA